MKKWFFPVIIFIIGILQAGFLNSIKIFNVKPDLLLIVVVSVSLDSSLRWALILSLLAGFMKDIFGTNGFGLNMLLFPLWSFITFRLSRKMSIETDFMRGVLIFIVSLLHNVLARLILVSPGNFIPLGIYLRILLAESAYTALVSPLLFRMPKPVYP